MEMVFDLLGNSHFWKDFFYLNDSIDVQKDWTGYSILTGVTDNIILYNGRFHF